MIENHHYTMLGNFKKRIALVIFFAYMTFCVIAGPVNNGEELSQDLPGSYDQKADLAFAVCTDLDVIHLSICQKNFLGEPGTFIEPPPELQIKCQTEQNVMFTTNSTKNWQLVVSVNSENYKEIINYRLIEGNNDQRINTIYTGKLNTTYTLWTTILDTTGSHAGWRRGPDIAPWEENKMEYDIQVDFLLDNYISGPYVEAKFYWNTSDDSCFLVHNICNQETLGNTFEKQIKPDDQRAVLVMKLLADDDCTLSVRGRHGHSELHYRTPACRQLPGCKLHPEKINKIHVKASEDEHETGTWVVEVSWDAAQYPQDFYNVTLFAAETHSELALGNATGVRFSGVSGEGLYEVYVTSVIGNETVFQSQLAVFPPRAAGVGELVIGAAWLTVLLAGGVVAAVFGWRRCHRGKRRAIYYTDIQDKSTKLSSSDSIPDLIVDDRWEVQPERLLLHEVIGEGAFGVVRRALLAPHGKEVAVKMLKDLPTVEEVRSFRAEMELMKSVGAHPHVVSLLACCSGRRPLIVAEYCSRGDLLSYLRSACDMMISKRNARYYNNNRENFDYKDLLKGKEMKEQPNVVVNRLYDLQGVCDAELTMPDLLSFCRQIAMGMVFLASNRLVHRDLAARNVLMTADKTLKIADFGLSRDVYQENQYKQKCNGKMPVKWMALESLTHRIYTTQSDVWSFGVVLWEVVTLGSSPYAALDSARLPRLLRAGYRMPRPANCDAQLYDVMLSCWQARPSARPTFTQLLARLDALLAACAEPYLPLDLHAPDQSPLPPDQANARPLLAPYRYVRMLFRTEQVWSSGRSYEWPQGAKHNYYTAATRPVALL